MAYSGGCVIGCFFKNPHQYYAGAGGTPPATYNAASTGGFSPQPQQWPFCDGANTPNRVVTTSIYMQQFWVAGGGVTFSPLGDRTIENNINALYVSMPRGVVGGGGSFTFAEASSASANFSIFATLSGGVWSGGGGVTAIIGQHITGLSQQLSSFLAFGYTGGFFRARGDITGTGAIQIGEDLRMGEALAVWAQELPNTQELVSYSRRRTDPSMVEVKTLDGAIRRYITGPSSTSMSATWKWSDDGSIAKNLDQIIEQARQNAAPLLVVIPRKTYYNGPFIDLVYPTNEPHPTMPAPGVYELTIEGTCQP